MRRAWPWIAGAVITVLVVWSSFWPQRRRRRPAPRHRAPRPDRRRPSRPPLRHPPDGHRSAGAATTRPAPARAINAREWQRLAKAPDAHVGESVIVYGHITQFDAGTGSQSFRASVDGVAHRQSYEYETNTLLSGDQAALNDVVEGDLFRAEAVVRGSYTYTTTMGGQMTVPSLWITSVNATGPAS